jgi:hypothetical protein
MIQLVVVFTLLAVPQDTMPNTELMQMQRKCGRQVLINSVVGFACTIGMGIFYAKGGDAYEDYKSSETMQSAAEAWDRVKLNDTMRNVFAAGAVIFLTRAVYYQIKRVRLQRSSALTPVIEVRYAAQPKLLIGLQKSL